MMEKKNFEPTDLSGDQKDESQSEICSDFVSTITFWSLLGPFFILATFFLSLVKETSGSYLVIPTVSLVGLVFCIKQRMKGLLIALGLLVLSLVYSYLTVPVEDRFWELGMAMTVALAFVVTALSFDEVDSLLIAQVVESKSRLKTLWALDKKLKRSRDNWESEYQKIVKKFHDKQQEFLDRDSVVHNYERVIGLVRRDLDASQEERRALLEELHAKGAQLAETEEKMRGMQKDLQQLSSQEHLSSPADPSQVKSIDQQNNLLVLSLSAEKRAMEGELELLKRKIVELEGQACSDDHLDQERLAWIKKMNVLRVNCYEMELARDQAEKDLKKYREWLSSEKKIKKKLIDLSKEIKLNPKGMVELQLSRYKSLYLQLRDQFEEKSDQLDKARKELFLVKEKLVAVEKEYKEESYRGLSDIECALEKLVLETDCERAQVEEEKEQLQELVTNLTEQLESKKVEKTLFL